MKHSLPAWTAPVLFGLLLSGMMSFIVSGLSTAIAAGVNRDLPVMWLGAWLPSWAVAFPTVLVVAPFVRKLVAFAVRPH